jgi:ribosomal-protein-alanine N-acetyltransferase
MDSKTITITSHSDSSFSNTEIASFLHTHLDQFGDEMDAILKCLSYAQDPAKGGDIFLAIADHHIIGAVVLNKTGMSDYIPENILVYIAVDNTYRGRGVGKKLMQMAIDHSEGSIALHCEPDNPALKLYQNLGFKNKYLEMRLDKSIK